MHHGPEQHLGPLHLDQVRNLLDSDVLPFLKPRYDILFYCLPYTLHVSDAPGLHLPYTLVFGAVLGRPSCYLGGKVTIRFVHHPCLPHFRISDLIFPLSLVRQSDREFS